ncbi:hypothetical protein BCEP4_60093 [Burkholderia cepacia]|nr:hypothetical protein BCEP4_60093 [Burkholderia cepacia]
MLMRSKWKRPAEADLFKKQMMPKRGLGHTCATPAALASAAFRVLTQSAGLEMKKGRLEADLFKNRWCPGEDSNLHDVATART